MSNDFLWPQLKELPAFRALIRASEARLLAELGPLPQPILDLGCGDGHFAQVTLGQVGVGIDLDAANLLEARERKVYASLSRASATTLPFANHTFACIISNCVIEHIPDNDAVMHEVARVLRPGGRFIFSVPTDRLNASLFVPAFLKRFGAHGLARKYIDWFTRMQVHFHMYSPNEWQRRVEAVGLRVVQQTGYISPRAARVMEFGHYWGLGNLISRKLTRRWVLWPWRPRFALEEAVLGPMVMENDPPGATCVFFVAIKDQP